MWRNAKARAVEHGLPFSITIADIVIPDLCPAFGMALEKGGGKRGGGPWSPSLDRIIPEHGYVLGNIQVVSRKFNIIKSNATPEELGAAAMFMLRMQQEKK